jgi:anti-sigma factor RsiW
VSQTHVQDDLLQRYFDGEVGDRQASEVRAHVDGCQECTARVASLSRLHSMFVAAREELAASVHSEALFARIRDGVHAAPEPKFGERLRLWWDDLLEPLRPRGMWAPAVVALGVAVALFVVTRTGSTPGTGAPEGPVAEVGPAEPGAGGTPAVVPTPTPPAPTPAPQLAAMLPSEVVKLESAIAATYFGVEAGEGTSTQVVWIEE